MPRIGKKAKKRPKARSAFKRKIRRKVHKKLHRKASRPRHAKKKAHRKASRAIASRHKKVPRKIQRKAIVHRKPATKIRRIPKVKVSKPRKAPAKKHTHVHRKPAPPKPVPVHIVDRRRQRTPSIQPIDFLLEMKSQIAEAVSAASGLDSREILPLLEKPPEGIEADFALPCFALSRAFKKDPKLIALNLYKRIHPSGMIKDVKQAGPYLNFLIDWSSVASGLLPSTWSERYGSSHAGQGKSVVVDFSSPNIAKPMSVGHLRSTTIGDSLCRIYSFLGYKTIGDNHLGDWGTQFGKIIVAYRKWGHPERLEKSPVEELLRLYVKFHEEAEVDKSLEEDARLAFKRLEDGDKESLALWKKITELSVAEFAKTYRLLGVRFDLHQGESFYDNMAKDVIEEAIKKNVAKWSQHALVIETGGDIPLIIRKSDEATLYSTRDLATIKYRIRKFMPERILYVVGSEQKSYLEQVFTAAQKLGYIRPGQNNLVHVAFGMISLPEGRMSTRKGRVVMLDHVIREVTDLAEKTIIIKNPELKDRKRIAQEVGIGALKYADLSRDRIKDVKFDWDEILSFEGDTGPYIQYTHARACSILRKGKVKAPPKRFNASLLKDAKESALIRRLAEFPETVRKAAEDNKPHYIANYVYTLATLFNEFYQSVPVLKAKKIEREARVALVFSVRNVLKSGLGLLGIAAPEEM